MKKKQTACLWLYAGVAAMMLVIMVIYSGIQEFWYDEVYQLGLVSTGKSLREVFESYTQLKDYTPPLYAFLAYGWVRIMPFSFRYFLLLSELLTAAGVFVMGLAGKKIGGRKFGIVTEIFAATSSVLVLSAGYEFRSYSLYFLAAALVIYTLAVRIRGGQRYTGLSAWLALVLLMYSHYYGCIIAAVLFVLEVVFVIAKKQKGRVLIPYLAAGSCFLPWMVLVFMNRTRSITEFWIQPPDLQSVFELLEFLCSENAVELWLLCLGLAGGIVSVVWKCCRKQFEFASDAMKVYLCGLLIGVIFAMYLYGALVNPSGGIFYNRYFIGLLPCCFVLMAQGVLWIWNYFSKMMSERNTEFVTVVLVLCLVLFVQNGNHLMKEIKKEMPLSYTSSAEALCRQEDIKDAGTVVVTSDNSCVRAGIETYFEEFYGTKANVISQHDDNFKEIVKKYNRVYLFYGKQPLTDETRELFEGWRQIERDKKNRIRKYVIDSES